MHVQYMHGVYIRYLRCIYDNIVYIYTEHTYESNKPIHTHDDIDCSPACHGIGGLSRCFGSQKPCGVSTVLQQRGVEDVGNVFVRGGLVLPRAIRQQLGGDGGGVREEGGRRWSHHGCVRVWESEFLIRVI